jgi:hypothetical protein
MPEDNSSYPPIADYALISDRRAVCREGARELLDEQAKKVEDAGGTEDG